MAASVCSRSAIDPGNRWIAGGVEHSALNAAGSELPNRSSTFAGPRKACSIGYCWSSIIPTSSAKGLPSSTASAWASPVIWMAISADLDRQHRAVGVEKDPLRVAAEDELADRRTTAQTDHDQLGVAGLGDADQVFRRLEAAHQLADLVGEPGRLELRLERRQVEVGLDGRVVVELPTTAVG